jgi:hypothetical protein
MLPMCALFVCSQLFRFRVYSCDGYPPALHRFLNGALSDDAIWSAMPPSLLTHWLEFPARLFYQFGLQHRTLPPRPAAPNTSDIPMHADLHDRQFPNLFFKTVLRNYDCT